MSMTQNLSMMHQNLVELHRTQSELFGPRVALRFKRDGLYRDLTWTEYREHALACASALLDQGVQPGDRVAVFSENRYEWLIADLGILTAGAVNVTPHAPLTAAQVEYELADSDSTWIFVSDQAQRDKIEQIKTRLPLLRGMVTFDPEASGGDAISWRAFLQTGREQLPRNLDELRQREDSLRPNSLATLMYTSGTTGQPKGVMLTHGNLLSNALSVEKVFPTKPTDVILSWLPYSHIYARTVDHYCSIATAPALCLADSVDTLVQNLAETHPTRIASVPRFYEKVLSLVLDENPEVTGARLRYIFGPRIVFLSSGGAPLPPAVAKAFHSAGLLLLQGYGLTETSPVISFNQPDDFKIETVGKAIPDVEVRIAEDGELLTRGPHVMAGYWKKPKETAEAIRDGWFYTGDLASIDDEGFISITGRKKELMVLSNGKKVVPPYLEGLILADECIDQIVVCGEGRNYLTALVVPSWERVKEVMGATRDEEALCRCPDVYKLLSSRIDTALTNVANWEQVKKIAILPKPFSVESEELTVSLKLRRNVIHANYSEVLEGLYREE